MKKYKKATSEIGRTLVEVLGILALMVMLTLGGVQVFGELKTNSISKALTDSVLAQATVRAHEALGGSKDEANVVSVEGPHQYPMTVRNGTPGTSWEHMFWVDVSLVDPDQRESLCKKMTELGQNLQNLKNQKGEDETYWLDFQGLYVLGAGEAVTNCSSEAQTIRYVFSKRGAKAEGNLSVKPCEACVEIPCPFDAVCRDNQVLCRPGYAGQACGTSSVKCTQCTGNTIKSTTACEVCEECPDTKKPNNNHTACVNKDMGSPCDLNAGSGDQDGKVDAEGNCVQCLENADCSEGYSCDTTLAEPVCTPCEDFAVCPNCPEATPLWNGMACVQCAEDSQCNAGEYCSEENVCTACTEGEACPLCTDGVNNCWNAETGTCEVCKCKEGYYRINGVCTACSGTVIHNVTGDDICQECSGNTTAYCKTRNEEGNCTAADCCSGPVTEGVGINGADKCCSAYLSTGVCYRRNNEGICKGSTCCKANSATFFDEVGFCCETGTPYCTQHNSEGVCIATGGCCSQNQTLSCVDEHENGTCLRSICCNTDKTAYCRSRDSEGVCTEVDCCTGDVFKGVSIRGSDICCATGQFGFCYTRNSEGVCTSGGCCTHPVQSGIGAYGADKCCNTGQTGYCSQRDSEGVCTKDACCSGTVTQGGGVNGADKCCSAGQTGYCSQRDSEGVCTASACCAGTVTPGEGSDPDTCCETNKVYNETSGACECPDNFYILEGVCTACPEGQTSTGPNAISCTVPGCSSNDDCQSGEFCNIPETYESACDPLPGICTSLASVGYETMSIGSTSVRAGNFATSWWGADNYCKAQGMVLLSVERLGCYLRTDTNTQITTGSQFGSSCCKWKTTECPEDWNEYWFLGGLSKENESYLREHFSSEMLDLALSYGFDFWTGSQGASGCKKFMGHVMSGTVYPSSANIDASPICMNEE